MSLEIKRGKNPWLNCPFVFGGRECGYVGTNITCSKTIDGCLNKKCFGGFPPFPDYKTIIKKTIYKFLNKVKSHGPVQK